MDKERVCSKCGKKLKTEDKYCMDCKIDIEIKEVEMQLEM